MPCPSLSVRPIKPFDDACGTAHALELLGERWALLVVRELMFGPRRFSQLRADLPGISANVLTQRLAELEARGILIRRRLPPPASVQVYELTPWGYEVEPIVQVLGRWAARSPGHDPTQFISGVSILLSFRTMINRAAAKHVDWRIGFVFGEDEYVATVRDGGIEVERRAAQGCNAVFAGEPTALAAAVYGQLPFEALANVLTVTGDVDVARVFTRLFVLPPKVAQSLESPK